MKTQTAWNPNELSLRSRNLLRLRLPGFSGASRLNVPFHVLIGEARKPRALLVAGVHGDEYESVAALQQLASEVDPSRLHGAVVIVPVANPLAFHAGTRRTPADLGDLNRAFPGNPEGTLSERLADWLFQNFVLGSDAVLSMHCWSKEATVIPYVEYPIAKTPVAKKSASLARALGLGFLHPYEWPAGLLVASAVQHGIPAVETEVGGMGTVTPEGQQSYRSIVYRFLQGMRLLAPRADETESPHRSPKIVGHSDCRADHPGLFRSRCRAGGAVERGDLLGTVHDLSGECLHEVRAPKNGVVGISRKFASVQPGDLLFQVFWPIGKTQRRRKQQVR